MNFGCTLLYKNRNREAIIRVWKRVRRARGLIEVLPLERKGGETKGKENFVRSVHILAGWVFVLDVTRAVEA